MGLYWVRIILFAVYRAVILGVMVAMTLFLKVIFKI
jgi:hypothetical protein